MRIAVAALGLVLVTGEAFSQQTPTADPSKDSQNSTGRTIIPEKQGPAQPQGHTGPIDTKIRRRSGRESAGPNAAWNAVRT